MAIFDDGGFEVAHRVLEFAFGVDVVFAHPLDPCGHGGDQFFVAVEAQVDGGISGVRLETFEQNPLNSFVLDAQTGEQEFHVGAALAFGFFAEFEQGLNGGFAEFAERFIDVVGRFAVILMQKVDQKGEGGRVAQGAEDMKQIDGEVDAILFRLLEAVGGEFGGGLRPPVEDGLNQGAVDANAPPAGFVQEVAQRRIGILRRQEEHGISNSLSK